MSQSRSDGLGQFGVSHGEENTNIWLPIEQLVVLFGWLEWQFEVSGGVGLHWAFPEQCVTVHECSIISHINTGHDLVSLSAGSQKERRERESGYFSLGRAAGSRAGSSPYRHSERGHPLPSNKSPEPKATIPFRNPALGVPSERRTSEFQNAEQIEENYSPEPLDLSLEVEALAGPRALSPTPFKQAESLCGSGRKAGRNAHTSPVRQSGTLDSSQRGSVLSRSSSPSPFRRAESSSSLNTVGFRSGGVSHGQDRASVNPARNAYSGNLRSFSSTAGTVSSINKSLSQMDLRSTLRKPETDSSFPEIRGSSSPSRRSYEGPAVRKTETKSPGHDKQSSFSSVGRYDSRSQSPSRQSYDRKTETKSPSYERGPDRQGFSSSSSLKSRYETQSQSPSRQSYDRKTERKSPSYERGPDRQGFSSSSSLKSRFDSRSQSPSRQSYDRKTETKSPSYERGPDRQAFSSSSSLKSRYDSRSQSPSRQSYDRKTETKIPSYERGPDRQAFSSSSSLKSRYDSRSQSPMGRIETNGVSRQIQESRRSASPVRKGYGTPSQSDRRSMSNGWSHERKSPSPSRKSYETQSQATMKKPEAKSSLHSYNRESRHSSPSRGHHQNPGPSPLRKSETSQSSKKRGSESRSPSPLSHSQSPPRKSESGRSPSLSTLRREIADHAPLRNTVSGSASYIRNTTTSQSQHDSSGPWRGSAHSLHSQSVLRNSSPSRHTSEKKPIGSFTKSAWETPQDGSKRSSVRQNLEAQSSMSDNRRAPSRHRSPSPPVQRHTSSQSSMDSESSHLSAGSSGLNREEYAMMADLPKGKTVFEREGPSHLSGMESKQKRELSRYKPARWAETV